MATIELNYKNMINIRSTKTVKLRKGASGLDFEVKGGAEHGIPIVVSRVDAGGVADGKLDVGDEIMAVNSKSLKNLKHSDAVRLLKTEGPQVTLTIRFNPVLRDMFTEDAIKDAQSQDSVDGNHVKHKPLPQGWSEKIDQQTGRPYYECHYTETTSWTDPRSLPTAVPLEEFNWTALPPGWERHRNNKGEIYYVNHDTQTTHWDCPVGARQYKHLKILQEHIDRVKTNAEDLETELADKRQKLVNLEQQLDSESDDTTPDTLDDVMLLNNEVEQLDDHVTSLRQHLQSLIELSRRAQLEEVNDQMIVENCHKDARELVKIYREFKSGQLKLHEHLSKADNSGIGPDMGLAYLLQLPPLQNNKEMSDVISCLHLLPDHITPKTSLELAIEIKLLVISKQRLLELHQLIQLQTTHQMGDMIEEISKIELPDDQWINLSFIEKLQKWTDCI